jgi:hypothetical protein
MADTQTPAEQTPEQQFAAFDAMLEHTSSDDGHVTEEPTPEPVPEPEPEPDAKPVAAAAEPPKVDRRTREGRKLSIQQEIDDLSSQRHTTKSEVEATKTELATLKAELATLSAQRTQAAPPPAPAAPVAPTAPSQAEWERYASMPDAPDITKFDDLGKYQFAVNTFVTRQMLNEHAQVTAQQQRTATQSQSFQQRIQAEAAKDATFTERLNSTNVDTRMIPYLHQHSQGPELMVYLVNHPEIAQRLITLNLDPRSDRMSVQQIEAIGEIVGVLKSSAAASAGPASKPSPISRAKPIIKPVMSSPDVSDGGDENDDDISVDEHIRRENARERSRYAR